MSDTPAPEQPPENTSASQPAKPALKASLRMRKDDEPRDFTPIEKPGQAEPVITHFKPIKPAAGFNYLSLLGPILVSAVIAGGAYFGYAKLNEQTARITTADTAAMNAESDRDASRRRLSDLEGELRDTDKLCADTQKAIADEKEKAVREAPYKAEAEFRPKFDEVATKLADAKRGIAEADRTAEGKAREAATEAQRQVTALEPKVEELERQVADLKRWLNANTKTMHPKYPNF